MELVIWCSWIFRLKTSELSLTRLSLWLFNSHHQLCQFSFFWQILSVLVPSCPFFQYSDCDLMDHRQCRWPPTLSPYLQSFPFPEFSFLNCPFHHVTLLMNSLWCLPVSCRIKYKLISLAFKAFTTWTQPNIWDIINPQLFPFYLPAQGSAQAIPFPFQIISWAQEGSPFREKGLQWWYRDSTLIPAASWMCKSEQFSSSLNALFSPIKWEDWITWALMTFAAILLYILNW